MQLKVFEAFSDLEKDAKHLLPNRTNINLSNLVIAIIQCKLWLCKSALLLIYYSHFSEKENKNKCEGLSEIFLVASFPL